MDNNFKCHFGNVTLDQVASTYGRHQGAGGQFEDPDRFWPSMDWGGGASAAQNQANRASSEKKEQTKISERQKRGFKIILETTFHFCQPYSMAENNNSEACNCSKDTTHHTGPAKQVCRSGIGGKACAWGLQLTAGENAFLSHGAKYA